MKSLKHLIIGLVFVMSAGSSLAASDWVVDIMPGTALANFAADGFEVTGANGTETLSLISSVPNVAVGLAIEQPEGYIDLKAGGGMLLNSKVSSKMVFLSAGLQLEVKPSIFIGPHASIAYYTKPEWWGDTDVQFSGTPGFITGVHLSAGDKISYLLSVDYFSMAFDVNNQEASGASDDVLDMSGLAVQFGVRAQF